MAYVNVPLGDSSTQDPSLAGAFHSLSMLQFTLLFEARTYSFSNFASNFCGRLVSLGRGCVVVFLLAEVGNIERTFLAKSFGHYRYGAEVGRWESRPSSNPFSLYDMRSYM